MTLRWSIPVLLAAAAAGSAAGQTGADIRNHCFVVAGVLCRIQIDQLHLGEAGESVDPAIDIGGFNRKPLALHELDDPAALKIN